MTETVIFTHTGKLGDFLYTLPIASWLYKSYGTKIKWILPECFGPFRYIENLLMLQPFTDSVHLIAHKIENYDCGGQPYRFEPKQYGDFTERYFNFGFRYYPDKYLSAFYAEEFYPQFYGRDDIVFSPYQCYDHAFILDLGPKESWEDKHPLCSLRTTETAMAKLLDGIEPMPTHEDLLLLARMLSRAFEVHTWFCGIAVLCYFARIPAIVHRVPGHAPLDLYFNGDLWRSYLTIVEHEKHPFHD